MTKFTKLTTNTTVKVIAVLLLIACSFICVGSTICIGFAYEAWPHDNLNRSDIDSADSYMELNATRSSLAYDYLNFISSSMAGYGAELAKDDGSTVPYLGYWANYDGAWEYTNMYYARNLEIQVYDFSSDGVTYDANGDPVYGDQKAADDKMYMYKKSDNAAFLLDSDDSKADRKLYDQLRDQLQYIQLMPQTFAHTIAEDAVYTDDAYASVYYDEYTGTAYENTAPTAAATAPTAAAVEETEGTYGMDFVGAKIFKYGMPEQRKTGTLLFDSDQIIGGDHRSSETPDDTTGYTIALMHRNGMVAFCTVREPMKYFDKYWVDRVAFNVVVPLKNALISVAIVSGLLALALFIFLMIAAGRRTVTAEEAEALREKRNEDENNDGDSISEGANEESDEAAPGAGNAWNSKIHRNGVENKTAEKGFIIAERWPDRIPLDVLFVIVCLIIGAFMAVFALGLNSGPSYSSTGITISSAYPLIIMMLIAAVISTGIGIVFCMSCSVRFKLGRWWKNTLCWKVCAWALHLCGRIIKKILGPAASAIARPAKVLAKQAVKAIGSIGVQWKLSVLTAIILAANLFMGYEGYWHGGMLFLMIIADIVIFLVILAIGLMLRRLQKGGEALASGDLKAKVDTDKMVGDFKRHGENLNSISDGMAIAIDQRMRSERLKTELITNVSHDIKTPLTSIVNYVDLLSKEDLEGMPAEYVEVLRRQSARLKKLTEDLVEASKAATGNINVDLKKTDIRETVNQAVGEYSEKLEKAALNVVVNAPETPVMAEADGRLLWRVLDNLLSNVCKYSMQGTRVYITVSETGAAGVTAGKQYTAAREGLSGIVRIEVKNISRDVLNVSAEDLMERFVRGDSSRTSATEGSGLGLNIAKSLTELQGGRFRLTVDGDLFKAEIILKK